MLKRILLLAGDVEANYLTQKLISYAPHLDVIQITTIDALSVAVASGTTGTRLLSVFSDVIVPAEVLNDLPGPAYNFHPGPPEYPGIYPSCFATYEGAVTFGVTLHEMAPAIDAGNIVEVRCFPCPESKRFIDLEAKAYEQTIFMFNDYAERLATDATPLSLSDDRWSGRYRSKSEWQDMQKVTPEMSEDEVRRRLRAFG